MAFDSKIYNVEWRKIARFLLPVLLRKPKLLALIYSAIVPIGYLYNAFKTFKKAIEYRLKITPQVCYLEKALNDRYDYSARRIYIIDAKEYDALPLFLKTENKPLVLKLKSEGHLVLYTKGETGAFTCDFLVMVPSDIVFDMVELTAFVTAYKLLSKVFQVNIF